MDGEVPEYETWWAAGTQEESEAAQMDVQKHLTIQGEKRRIDGDLIPTFALPLLTKQWCPGKSHILTGTLLVWPLKLELGANAKEVVGYSEYGVGKSYLLSSAVCLFFPTKSEDWQRRPSSESPQAPGRTGVGQEVRAPSTVLMVWVEISQA